MDAHKRKVAWDQSKEHIIETLSPLNDFNINASSTLFELSKLQHKQMKNNTIHLSGKIRKNYSKKVQTLYSSRKFGTNISMTRKMVSIGKIHWYQYINIIKTTR